MKRILFSQSWPGGKIPIPAAAAFIALALSACGGSTPTTPAGWYQAGHSWGARERATGDEAAPVGITEADYCAAVLDQASLIPGNPLSNIDWTAPGNMPAPSPSPQTNSDAMSWINGCAAGNTLPGPATSAPAAAPDSAPAAAGAPTTPSSGNTGQPGADSAAEQQAQTDLSTVQSISYSSDLAALREGVKGTINDAATLKAAIAAGLGVDCDGSSAINTAAAKLFSPFASDDSNGANYAATLQQDISTARSDISTLQDDVTGLQSTGSPLPSGTQAAITSAKNAISEAVTNGNAAIDQENALINQALPLINSFDTPSDQCANTIQQYGAGNPIAHVS